MKYSILLAIGLSLMLPLQADAKPGKNKKNGKATPEQIFKKKDKDNDGMLTKEEAIAKKKNPDKAEKQFAKIDKNSDGKISLEEFTSKKNRTDKTKNDGKKNDNENGKKDRKKGGK